MNDRRPRRWRIGLMLVGALALALSAVIAGAAEEAATPEPEALPSLQQQLDARAAASAAKASPEAKAAVMATLEELRRAQITQKAIQVGDKAPDFALPGIGGQTVRLSDLLQEGPVVVAWYRGGWCPYCNLQLHALQQALPQIESRGARLVAISPEKPDNSLTTAQKHDLKFHVLSDGGNAVARDYGLIFTLPDALRTLYGKFGIDLEATNGDASWTLPLPAVYVIDKSGRVTYAFLDVDYKRRAEPATIVQELDKLKK